MNEGNLTPHIPILPQHTLTTHRHADVCVSNDGLTDRIWTDRRREGRIAIQLTIQITIQIPIQITVQMRTVQITVLLGDL